LVEISAVFSSGASARSRRGAVGARSTAVVVVAARGEADGERSREQGGEDAGRHGGAA
jgi:hypothetical protein